jgi:LuxR family transcriptional regulator of csgAB operon
MGVRGAFQEASKAKILSPARTKEMRMEAAMTMTEKEIFIVGPLKLQNALMRSFLMQETGAACQTLEHFSDIPLSDNGNDLPPKLLLWDCFGKDLQSCLLELETNAEFTSYPKLLGLFNVRAGTGIEEGTLTSGVRGFFYQEDSPEQFCKGVSAMFDGELWISRKIMSDCILYGKSQNSRPVDRNKILTNREIEILTIIAAGETNESIADKLCISSHTVKTHIYNIFKKINVPNRLQAALWAAKNL